MEVIGQFKVPAALHLPRERPLGTHSVGWVGPRAGLDTVDKSLDPTRIRTPVAQAVTRRYTDWAIPVKT
jgi:hypothetical protein